MAVLSVLLCRTAGPRFAVWVSAGSVLVIALASFWYFDSHRFTSDAERLRRLQNASLQDNRRGQDESADWPQWRGPARDGIALGPELRTDWPAEGPPVLWRATAGDGYSGLSVANGRVFTQFQYSDDEEAVSCWNADTGSQLWCFHYPCPPLIIDHGSGPRATPTVDHDLVFCLGAASDLYCLNAADGKKVWHHNLADEFSGPAPHNRKLPMWGAACSPLVEGDRVFIATCGTQTAVAAFEKRTGDVIWKALDDPPSYSSPIAATIDGTRQIIFFTGRGLVGLTPDDGTVLWRYPWETNDNCNVATPIALGNYVFISSGYDRGCALLEIHRTGSEWSADPVYEHRSMRNHFSTCVLYKDHLYGFDNATLTCMAFRTGEIRWRHSGLGKGSLLIAGAHLVILGESRRLVVAAADPDKYREESACDVPFLSNPPQRYTNRCWALPALAGGRLYLRDQLQILCLDLMTEHSKER